MRHFLGSLALVLGGLAFALAVAELAVRLSWSRLEPQASSPAPELSPALRDLRVLEGVYDLRLKDTRAPGHQEWLTDVQIKAGERHHVAKNSRNGPLGEFAAGCGCVTSAFDSDLLPEPLPERLPERSSSRINNNGNTSSKPATPRMTKQPRQPNMGSRYPDTIIPSPAPNGMPA